MDMTYKASSLRVARASVALTALAALSACAATADIGSVRHHPLEAPVIHTSPVRSGVTPMTGPLACFGDMLKAQRDAPLGIAVGDVKDYTGKQSQDEGFVITQGGALMAYSALGKIGKGVRLHERFDTRIAEAELVYMDRRQLGDGTYHSVDDPNAPDGKAGVPWKPYYGGTIRQSDFFIVGGITELNYNIQSGGGEVAVSNIGPKARLYTMNVAVDLRIVGSQTLLVYDTVSIEKQLTGYEVGFGVFRFFGNELFDVNIGAKNQEPLQMGVRTAIEAGVLELVASVAGVDPGACVPAELGPVEWDGAGAAAVRKAANARPAPAAEPLPKLPPPSEPGTFDLPYAARDDGGAPEAEPEAAALHALERVDARTPVAAPSGGEFAVVFAVGEDAPDPASSATLERVAELVGDGRDVNLLVSGHEGAGIGDEERRRLRDARMVSIVAALMRHGVPREKARLLWHASQSPTLLTSVGGIREIARLRVG